jgi:membrane associated rhomboid family serine protease
MLIPYSTDAPIYHWPFATLGTIVVNALVFFGILSLPEDQQERIYGQFILHYGHWNPVQWVTSNYLHGSFLHVFGNMVVLWGIGIIIEGKVGWWAFLLIYNGIGILQCGVEQTLMLFAEEGGSLGASAIIYGLIAMAMIWAPRNELNCILLIGFRSLTIDLPVVTYAGISLAIEFLLGAMSFLALSEKGSLIAMTSQILHLMGAASGFVVGVAMLKWRWVDCENWDLFSVMKERHLKSRDELAKEALSSDEGQKKLADHRVNLQTHLRNYLAAGEAAAALAVHRRAKIQFGANWEIGEQEHIQLISGLQKAEKWDDAVQMMGEYLQTRHERAHLVRLALAQLLVERLGRPKQALKVLSKLDPKSIAPKQQAVYNRLVERAKKDAEDDPFEVTADDW